MDPIYAAIEAHHRAIAAHAAAVDIECSLEVALPKRQRRSDVTVWEEKIVETDDPRWLAAIRERAEASRAMDDRAIDLVNVTPTTTDGVEALLRYFAYREDALFPEEITGDEGNTWPFGAYLVRHAADALRRIAAPDCQPSGALRRIVAGDCQRS